MSEFTIRLISQEGRDAHGRLQSHQHALVPADLAGAFMSGGLKKIRRMAESYFSYRFSSAAAQVRGAWRSGEPTLRRQFHGVPFVHGRRLVSLGRLRSAGTLNVYRGYHEIRGGEIVSNSAQVLGRQWPADMPWVAPSAGEFIQNEQHKTAYLGIFEIRVERTADGCALHTLLVDFPPAEKGMAAGWLDKPWAPMRRNANLDFLRAQITDVARELGHGAKFTIEDLDGTPPRPLFRFDRHSATA